jgi:tetratricopeptide (TPR) repeat protein
LGVLHSRQKEWQKAIECFERFLDISQETGFAEGRASAYTELGNLYRLKHQWSRAERLLKQGIDLAHSERDYVVLAQGYQYLGLCYSWQGNPESADMLYRALDIVQTRTKQPAQEARVQNTLAETLVRMNRWHEAEDAFRASAKIKERLGDKAGLAMTYGGLGRLYFRQWRFDLAAEHLKKDIDLLAEEFDANVAWIQQLTNTIGEVRRLQGQLDQAAASFAQALSLLEQIPDPGVRKQSQGYTHMLLARLAMDRGDLDAAEKACQAALEKLDDTWAEGEVQRTAARLARMLGDTESARLHLDKALAAAEHTEDIDRALCYLEQAYFYEHTGDSDQMREWAQRVVALARRLHNRELASLASQLSERG